MGLTTVVRAAEDSAPLIILGILATLEETGLFRVAFSAMLLAKLSATVLSMMVPALVAPLMVEGEERRLARLTSAACVAMAAPTLIVAAVFWIFGEPLLGLAFGPGFVASWAALAILSLGAVIEALGGISISLLHAAHRESAVVRAFAISLVLTVGGSLLLAPSAGATGVALASLFATVVRTLFLALVCRSALGLDPTILGAALRWRGAAG